MSRNNNHNDDKSHPPAHQTLNLARLAQQREELRARLAREEAQIEAAMRAEQIRMEEERREAEERRRVEQLRREEAERKRRADEVRKQQEAAAEDDDDDDEEPEAGPSAPKKRKVQDTSVSDRLPPLHQANGATQEVRQLTKQNSPSCSQCTTGSAVCYGKSRGPSCWRCFKRKMSCSLVVQKRKKEEKGKGRVVEEEEEPEGLQNILERLTDAVVGIGCWKWM